MSKNLSHFEKKKKDEVFLFPVLYDLAEMQRVFETIENSQALASAVETETVHLFRVFKHKADLCGFLGNILFCKVRNEQGRNMMKSLPLHSQFPL